ncbi:MAG: hypothetical protein HKN09_10445 [Saprospiraceae bacterium]|nr:hypothetical protein [Saprospiraceae bacterium]
MDTLVIFTDKYNWKRFQPKLFRAFDTLAIHPDFQEINKIKWYPEYINLIDYSKSIPFRLLEWKSKKGLISKIIVNEKNDAFDAEFEHKYIHFRDQFFLNSEINPTDHIQSDFFKTSFLTDFAQLSFSIRYGCYLGYKRIILKGVEKEHVGEVVKTLRDVKSVNPNIEIYNGDFKSIDDFNGIVEYINLDQKKKRKILNAIAVPTIEKELPLVIDNFKLWDKPENYPMINIPKSPNVDLVFIYGQQRNQEIEDKIYEAFLNTTYVKHCFRNLRFKYAELSDEDNIYSQDYINDPLSVLFQKSPKGGYKVGPNNVFYFMIKTLKEYDYIFQMETDCIVVKKNWLWQLQNIVQSMPHDFWLMGSIYRGLSELDPVFKNHINGNAIYATGDDSFQEFMDEQFIPYMDSYIKNKDPRIAFDIGFQIYLNDPDNWPFVQTHIHKFNYTEYVQNLAGHPKFTGGDRHNIHIIRDLYPDTYLVHGKLVRTDLPKIKLSQNTNSISKSTQEIENQLKVEGNTRFQENENKISEVINNEDHLLLSIKLDFENFSKNKEHNIIDFKFLKLILLDDYLCLSIDREEETDIVKLCPFERQVLLQMEINKNKKTLLLYINGLLNHVDIINRFKCKGIYLGDYDNDKSWSGNFTTFNVLTGEFSLKEQYTSDSQVLTDTDECIDFLGNQNEYFIEKSLINN